jgi:hypothetical protein
MTPPKFVVIGIRDNIFENVPNANHKHGTTHVASKSAVINHKKAGATLLAST